MAGITLSQAQEQLEVWLAASKAVAGSQSYTIQTENGSRTLTRANAAWIQTQIDYWDLKVKKISVPANKRRRTVRIVG